jgi:hypothetical protein
MDKMNKNDIIESIKYHYFKKGRLCMNLNKQPKEKLIEHMTENNIDVIKSLRFIFISQKALYHYYWLGYKYRYFGSSF